MVAWVLAWVCAANRGYGNTGSGYYVDSNAVLGMRSRRDTMAIYRKKSLFLRVPVVQTKLETCKPSIFEATYKKVGNWDAFDSDHMDSILDT